MLSISNESSAIELVKRYFNGWKNNDIQMITNSLEKDVLIIESHGLTYQGITDLKKWFDFWLNAESKIPRWEIKTASFCEKDQSVFCEWDFECISFNKTYAFPGASVIKLSSNLKISSIHEYKMSNPPYKWNGNKLTSE